MARAAAALSVGWQNERSWPNLAQTASYLAVDPSTLSKQADKGRVFRVKRGLGRRRTSLVPPREVLRLAVAIGRVPLEEVKRRMAQGAARRVLADERSLLRELDRMDLAVEEAGMEMQQEAAGMSVPETTTTESRGRAREVSLGRMQPRRIAESEAISASLVQALDKVSPRQLLFRPGQRRAREVNLGKLRPQARL